MQFDMQNMLGQVKRLQQEMEKKQSEVKTQVVTAESGGRMVVVTMTGAGRVTGIKIDKLLTEDNDIQMLEDLVVAAVNKAKDNVDKLLEEAMGGISSMLPNIPGMNL